MTPVAQRRNGSKHLWLKEEIKEQIKSIFFELKENEVHYIKTWGKQLKQHLGRKL